MIGDKITFACNLIRKKASNGGLLSLLRIDLNSGESRDGS